MENKLSHVNEAGQAVMVDVSDKNGSVRKAIATGVVNFDKETFEILAKQDFLGKKGSIIQTAVIAGIQGAKKTAALIPLCHSLLLTKIDVVIVPAENSFQIACTVQCEGKTGVEMEALTGVSIAALTLYDMCKALSHNITVTDIQLTQKTGGKNDFTR